jgi:hypothetical protein
MSDKDDARRAASERKQILRQGRNAGKGGRPMKPSGEPKTVRWRRKK